MEKPYKKPHLGVMPGWMWNEDRVTDISDAIIRCLEAKANINVDWVMEYNGLIRQEGCNVQP